MNELKCGTIVNLINGGQASIIKELGRDGQGIEYLVAVDGQQMALKWYLKSLPDWFYQNLEENISKAAPSDAFLWPEYLTKKENGSYGYIIKLRPHGYNEFGEYLLVKKRFGSFEAVLNAAMKICDSFYKLHLSGLCYHDLNEGDFLIEPNTGDLLICDIDNLLPEGEMSGIFRNPRYMAPEVVNGKAPDKFSDRFSLAVILFRLLFLNHPFEGASAMGNPCLTESLEKKFSGSEHVFIYDPTNDSNRPIPGVHTNVIRRWSIMPAQLREAFQRQFSPEILMNPEKRMKEAEWMNLIQTLSGMIDKSGPKGSTPNAND